MHVKLLLVIDEYLTSGIALKLHMYPWIHVQCTCSFDLFFFLILLLCFLKQIKIEERNGDNYLSAGEVKVSRTFSVQFNPY